MKPLSEIVPGFLYLGKARPYDDLQQAGMDVIVNVARRSYDGARIHLPIKDGAESPDRLIEVVETIRNLVARTVYLHCAAGHSRSPTIAALYVLRYTEYAESFAEALAWVKLKHRSTRPNPRIIAAALAVAERWKREAR